MTKDFYFSYGYDLTSTFQHNYLCQESTNLSEKNLPSTQDAFEWNNYQTEALRVLTKKSSMQFWLLAVIHGSFCQRRFTLFGKEVVLYLVARRSRHYAGTRYLKRGISVHGKVANDCETEQIVQLDYGKDAQFCSHVQVRGSIPVYWSQETSVTMPKPPININRVDPNYVATQEHFTDLLVRYGAPVVVLDLVKQQEKNRRETLVGAEYRQALSFINLYMPRSQQIRYCALDYDLLKKNRRRNRALVQDGAGLGADGATAGRERALSDASDGDGKVFVQADAGGHLANKRFNFARPTDAGGTGSSYSGYDNSLAIPKSVALKLQNTKQLEKVMDKYVAAPKPIAGDVIGDDGHTQDVLIAAGTPGASGGSPKSNILEDRISEVTCMSIHETGVFSSDTTRLATIAELRPSQVKAAVSRGYMLQSGVMRTNCIDCIDRTNAAQIYMGIKGLQVSCQILGIPTQGTTLDSTKHSEAIASAPAGEGTARSQTSHGDDEGLHHTSDDSGGTSSNLLVRALIEMYTDMGNRISIQYGGSEAHLKFAGIDTGKSAVGEQLTSVKRYYNNSFLDIAKQHAMNVFLGMFVPTEDGSSSLQESEGGDYHLHNRYLWPEQTYASIFLFQTVSQFVKVGLSAPLTITGLQVDMSDLAVQHMQEGEEDIDDEDCEVGLKTAQSSRAPSFSCNDLVLGQRLRQWAGGTTQWIPQRSRSGAINALPIYRVVNALGSGDDRKAIADAATAVGAGVTVAQKVSTDAVIVTKKTVISPPALSPLSAVVHTSRPEVALDREQDDWSHPLPVLNLQQTLKSYQIRPSKAINTNKHAGRYHGMFREQLVKNKSANHAMSPFASNVSGGKPSSVPLTGANPHESHSATNRVEPADASITAFVAGTVNRPTNGRNSSNYNRKSEYKFLDKLRLECIAVRLRPIEVPNGFHSSNDVYTHHHANEVSSVLALERADSKFVSGVDPTVSANLPAGSKSEIVLSAYALARLLRSEKRKALQQDLQTRAADAFSMWWVNALSEHFDRTSHFDVPQLSTRKRKLFNSKRRRERRAWLQTIQSRNGRNAANSAASPGAGIGFAAGINQQLNLSTLLAQDDHEYFHQYKPYKLTHFDDLFSSGTTVASNAGASSYLIAEDASGSVITSSTRDVDASLLLDAEEIEAGLRSAPGLRARRKLLCELTKAARNKNEVSTKTSSTFEQQLLPAASGSEAPVSGAWVPVQHADLLVNYFMGDTGYINSTSSDNVNKLDAQIGKEVLAPFNPMHLLTKVVQLVATEEELTIMAQDASEAFRQSSTPIVNAAEPSASAQINLKKYMSSFQKTNDMSKAASGLDHIPPPTGGMLSSTQAAVVMVVSQTISASSSSTSASSAELDVGCEGVRKLMRELNQASHKLAACVSSSEPELNAINVRTDSGSDLVAGLSEENKMQHPTLTSLNATEKTSMPDELLPRTVQQHNYLAPWACNTELFRYNASAFAHMQADGPIAAALKIQRKPIVAGISPGSSTYPKLNLLKVQRPTSERPASETTQASSENMQNGSELKSYQDNTPPIERLIVCPPLPQSADVNIGPILSKKSIATYIQYAKLADHPELLGGHALMDAALWDASSSQSHAYVAGVPGSAVNRDQLSASSIVRTLGSETFSRTASTPDLISKTEFTSSLHDYTLSVDNVAAMETLADDFGVFETISRGMYSGMHQNELAADAEFKLQHLHVLTVPDLYAVGRLDTILSVTTSAAKLPGAGDVNVSSAELALGLGYGNNAPPGAEICRLYHRLQHQPAQAVHDNTQQTQILFKFSENCTSDGLSVADVDHGGQSGSYSSNVTPFSTSTTSGNGITTMSPSLTPTAFSDSQMLSQKGSLQYSFAASNATASKKAAVWAECLTTVAVEADCTIGNRKLFYNVALNNEVFPPHSVQHSSLLTHAPSWCDGILQLKGVGRASAREEQAAKISTEQDLQVSDAEIDLLAVSNAPPAPSGLAQFTAGLAGRDRNKSTLGAHTAAITEFDTMALGRRATTGFQAPSLALDDLDAPALALRASLSQAGGIEGLRHNSTASSFGGLLEAFGEEEAAMEDEVVTSDMLIEGARFSTVVRPMSPMVSAKADATAGSTSQTPAVALSKDGPRLRSQSQPTLSQLALGKGTDARSGNSTLLDSTNVRDAETAVEGRTTAILGNDEGVTLKAVNGLLKAGNDSALLKSSDSRGLNSNEEAGSWTSDQRGVHVTSMHQTLQKLTHLSRTFQLPVGLHGEAHQRAVSFVNQYGSYWRYLSHDRTAARLSFFMNDSCFDLYTQGFLSNTHLPSPMNALLGHNHVTQTLPSVSFPGTNSTINALTSLDGASGTGDSHANSGGSGPSGANAFGLSITQAHMDANWALGACFDEVAYIAVNPSPLDMVAGRSRWTGSAFLGVCIMAKPVLRAVRHVQHLLKQQMVHAQLEKMEARLMAMGLDPHEAEHFVLAEHATRSAAAKASNLTGAAAFASEGTDSKEMHGRQHGGSLVDVHQLDKNTARQQLLHLRGTSDAVGTGTSETPTKRRAGSVDFIYSNSSLGLPEQVNDASVLALVDASNSKGDDEDMEFDEEEDDAHDRLRGVCEPVFLESDRHFLVTSQHSAPRSAASALNVSSEYALAVTTELGWPRTRSDTEDIPLKTTLDSSTHGAVFLDAHVHEREKTAAISTDACAWSNRQYAGFLHLSGDMYCREGEPYLLLNEIAVRCILRGKENKAAHHNRF